jgi:hypothetical protein
MRHVLKPGGRLALACWRSIEHTPGYLALEQALARRIGPEKAQYVDDEGWATPAVSHIVTTVA